LFEIKPVISNLDCEAIHFKNEPLERIDLDLKERGYSHSFRSFR